MTRIHTNKLVNPSGRVFSVSEEQWLDLQTIDKRLWYLRAIDFVEVQPGSSLKDLHVKKKIHPAIWAAAALGFIGFATYIWF